MIVSFLLPHTRCYAIPAANSSPNEATVHAGATSRLGPSRQTTPRPPRPPHTHPNTAVPNFLIQEQIDQSLGAGLLCEDWQVRDGYIDLPTKPGLGFEIDEKEAEKDCEYREELGGEFYHESDGSVADW